VTKFGRMGFLTEICTKSFYGLWGNLSKMLNLVQMFYCNLIKKVIEVTAGSIALKPI